MDLKNYNIYNNEINFNNFDFPHNFLEGLDEIEQQYSPNILIICYQAGIEREHLLKKIEEYNAEIINDLKIMKSISIKIPENKEIEDAIEYFKKVDGVIKVNKNEIKKKKLKK